MSGVITTALLVAVTFINLWIIGLSTTYLLDFFVKTATNNRYELISKVSKSK